MKRYSQEEAFRIFKANGVIMTGQYHGRTTPVQCICSCGQQEQITLHTVQRGRKCRVCNDKNNAKKQKLTHESVKIEIELMGMQIVSQYQSFHIPLSLICECGKAFAMSLPNIRAGKRCGCKYQRGENHHSWVSDRNQLKERNKFKKACYSLVRRSLNGQVKTSKTKQLLGYNAEELRQHIINHAKYNDCVQSGQPISIDHIFPLKAFSDYGLLNESHIWLVNHLTNLQPSIKLWNSLKSDFYDSNEFELFLTKHGINVSSVQTIH